MPELRLPLELLPNRLEPLWLLRLEDPRPEVVERLVDLPTWERPPVLPDWDELDLPVRPVVPVRPLTLPREEVLPALWALTRPPLNEMLSSDAFA